MGLIISSETGKKTIFFRTIVFLGWFLVITVALRYIAIGVVAGIGGMILLPDVATATPEQVFRAGYEARVLFFNPNEDWLPYIAFIITVILAFVGKLPMVGKYE